MPENKFNLPPFKKHFENHLASIETKSELDVEKLSQPNLKADSYHKHQEKENRLENTESKDLGELFKSGNIEEIISFINEDKEGIAFSEEIERVQNEYRESLSKAVFLTEKDWEVLTAIEMFDKKILEHSIGTYLIAKDKLENRLIKIGINVESEGVKLEQFYRACLLHDIGKMAMPDFILNNKISEKEWTFHFMQFPQQERAEMLSKQGIEIPEEIRDDLDKITDFFYINRIRASQFVPMGELLSATEQKVLQDNGINPNLSIGGIMETHEKESEKMLSLLGYELEAVLAGNHHNYKHRDKQHGAVPVSLSAIHISNALSTNIMHIADVMQALHSDRSYHRRQPDLRILAFLVDDARNEIVQKITTASCINDELKKMEPAYLKKISSGVRPEDDFDEYYIRSLELETINNYLVDYLSAEEEFYLLTI